MIICFLACQFGYGESKRLHQLHYFLHGIVIVLTAVEVGVCVGEFAEQDGVPARGVQRAFNLVIVASLHIEQVEYLAEHGGFHQLGDGAWTGGIVEEENGVRGRYHSQEP